MSKWCVDCRHSEMQTGRWVGSWACRRPIGGLSLVTGEEHKCETSCEFERVDPTGCGPDGKFWEERT